MSKKQRKVYNPFRKEYWTKDNLFGQQKREKKNQTRMIRETKCTCVACGEVWFYGKEDITAQSAEKMEHLGNEMANCGKSMMCCSGCLPAIFIPEKPKINVRDFDQCHNCGSKAIKKESVVHHV